MRAQETHRERCSSAVLWSLGVAAATLAVAPGCSRLMDHPKPIVAVPAAIGGVAGGLVGVPLEIVFLPVGWAYGSFAPPPRKPYADDVPFLGMEIPSYVAATALGAPFWLAFGWWGIKGEDADDFGRPSDFLPQSFVSMLDGGARRKRAPIVTPTPVPEIAPPVSGHEGGIKR